MLYQDNKSTILLEKSGFMPSSKLTKHILSRHFFMSAQVEIGDVEIEHCPTKRVWANVVEIYMVTY